MRAPLRRSPQVSPGRSVSPGKPQQKSASTGTAQQRSVSPGKPTQKKKQEKETLQKQAPDLILKCSGLKAITATTIDPNVGWMTMNFSDNLLTSVDASFLTPFHATLISLNLAKNKLTALDPGIAGLDKLEKLNLDDNCLSSFPKEMGAMKSLTHLYARSNRIVRVPATFVDLTGLVEVDLSLNPLDGSLKKALAPYGPTAAISHAPATRGESLRDWCSRLMRGQGPTPVHLLVYDVVGVIASFLLPREQWRLAVSTPFFSKALFYETDRHQWVRKIYDSEESLCRWCFVQAVHGSGTFGLCDKIACLIAAERELPSNERLLALVRDVQNRVIRFRFVKSFYEGQQFKCTDDDFGRKADSIPSLLSLVQSLVKREDTVHNRGILLTSNTRSGCLDGSYSPSDDNKEKMIRWQWETFGLLLELLSNMNDLKELEKPNKKREFTEAAKELYDGGEDSLWERLLHISLKRMYLCYDVDIVPLCGGDSSDNEEEEED